MLSELLTLATRIGLQAKPGFSSKQIHWLLIFKEDGTFVDVHDLRADGKNGRQFDACPSLEQSEMVTMAKLMPSKKMAIFLADNLAAVALYAPSGKQVSKKEQDRHETFVWLLAQAKDVFSWAPAVAKALDDPKVQEQIHRKLDDKKARNTDLCTIGILKSDGTSETPLEHDYWHQWWVNMRERLLAEASKKKPGKKGGTKKMVCLLSGQIVEPAATQPKVKGLADVGGQTTGSALVSFDKQAFESYGLSQSANAAMSEQAAKCYVEALSYLLRERSHRLTNSKVVYWYSRDIPKERDILLDLFGEEIPSNDSEQESSELAVSQAELRVKRLLEAVRESKRPPELDARYYMMNLSANGGRIIVRQWLEGSFEQLADAINSWFEDLQIVSKTSGNIITAFKFWAILGAAFRDLGEAPSPLVDALWQAAIQKLPIPRPLVALTLRRIHADLTTSSENVHSLIGLVQPRRFALLRAFTVREEGVPSMPEMLDVNQTHPAYWAGCVMAILGKIQETALGHVGAGMVQRYYAAASSTPALVLGRLVRLTQMAHLPKIESTSPRLKVWYEKKLCDAWNRIRKPLPTTFSLEEQTLFAMGFYHQLADLYTRQPGEQASPEQAETATPSS